MSDASVAPPARSGAGTSATAAPARRRSGAGRERAAAGASVLADPIMPRAELDEWRERFGLVAGLTMRGGNGGFSLGLQTEEPVGQVMGRWRAFLHAIHPQFPAFQMAQQVHSAPWRGTSRWGPGGTSPRHRRARDRAARPPPGRHDRRLHARLPRRAGGRMFALLHAGLAGHRRRGPRARRRVAGVAVRRGRGRRGRPPRGRDLRRLLRGGPRGGARAGGPRRARRVARSTSGTCSPSARRGSACGTSPARRTAPRAPATGSSRIAAPRAATGGWWRIWAARSYLAAALPGPRLLRDAALRFGGGLAG